MLDIEKFIKQAERFSDCVKNIRAAHMRLQKLEMSPFSIRKDVIEVQKQLDRCSETLIGQIRIMNIQNQEELKS